MIAAWPARASLLLAVVAFVTTLALDEHVLAWPGVLAWAATVAAIEFVGPAAWEGRIIIGCWFWELETIPAEWKEAIDAVDGIMVASGV